MDFILDNYLVFKSLHIIAVISWMAALLYLPRLFVYHAEANNNSDIDLQFQIMERRLIKIIMNPAMVFAWLFGVLMILAQGFNSFGVWLHIKLTLLLFLSMYHGFCVKYYKLFTKGANEKSSFFFRVFNEIPSLMMVIIVLLAVMKPF